MFPKHFVRVKAFWNPSECSWFHALIMQSLWILRELPFMTSSKFRNFMTHPPLGHCFVIKRAHDPCTPKNDVIFCKPSYLSCHSQIWPLSVSKITIFCSSDLCAETWWIWHVIPTNFGAFQYLSARCNHFFFNEAPIFCRSIKWRHFYFGWPMQYVIIRHDFLEWGTHVSDDVINGSSLKGFPYARAHNPFDSS